jgi:serine/threonine protein kinase/TolB-like protein/Flp pilus assembly protein TadD
MNAERWQQIKSLLQAALDREPAERPAFLEEACKGDKLLRQQVNSFIISHEQSDSFIEEPAFEVMAESLENNQAEVLGRTLGHYKILDQIGVGGMGEVYLAEDTRLGRKVALKLLPPFVTRDDERVRRFQQEARAASALNHPNILTIYEIGQTDSRHFMATEFIEGETLRQRLAKTQMKIGEVLDVATQVAWALSAAHQAGIAHRDIKPGNIMLRPDGVVKVLDFGLAKLTEQKGDDLEAATLVHTKQGIVMGTAHYMSPEQARGQKMDARTDIFSLGVVLYEMVTGRVPFGGQTMTDVLASILMLDPPSLTQSAPEAPDELQRIVHKTLRKDKEERYRTAEELLIDLKALKQELEFETRQTRYSSSGSGAGAAVAANARPETRYARSGDVNIAYQVLGDGPIDLVYVPGWVTNIDYSWEDPSLARYYRRLASFSRLILFDKRGTGLSDQTAKLPTLEQRMDDVRAVMDAVGCERAALFGASEGGNMSLLFAATYPERTSALVTVGIFANRTWAPEYPWAPTPEERQKWYDLLEQGWGGAVDLSTLAPSVANDERFNQWWASFLRLSASPGAALALARTNSQIDVRHILPAIRVPTLVLHRTGDLDVNVEEGRFIAARIPGAKFVELPGRDHLPWVGDQDAILDEVEEFLRSIHYVPELDRVLATVLFIQTIGPTAAAASLRPHQWRDLLERHYQLVSRELAQFRGHEIEITENRLLATFDGPARAIRAASGVNESARLLGIEIKSGLHTGECDVIGDKVGGVAVEIGSQVAAKATSGEILVSSTVKDLVAGSGIQFEDRGAHALKGVAGKWRLFAVKQDTDSGPVTKSLTASKTKGRRRGKAIDSLAVLPLMNDSPDPDMEYFSDGVTESIINALSQLPKLRVVARSTVFRYKGRQVDAQEVGQQLGVRAVLTGRVRQAGDGLMIAAELIDVTNDTHLWGEHYSRSLSDIFVVQEEIAKEISGKLRLKLTGEEKKRLAKRHTENTEAYKLYLRGLYYWNKRTVECLKKGIEYFEQAIEMDPNYALAYAGLADSYVLLGRYEALSPKESFPKAKAAAMKALQIDPGLAEAFPSLASAKFKYDWDWANAERDFKHGIELNPNCATAHHWYGHYLWCMGRFDEAFKQTQQALQLDPLSLMIDVSSTTPYLYARQYDRVIKNCRRVIDLHPNFPPAHTHLGWAYEQTGQLSEAVAELQKACLLDDNPENLASLGHAYAKAGKIEEARGQIEKLQEISRQRYASPYGIALIHMGLGEKEQALSWLETAYEDRSYWLVHLKVDPRFDGLRSDPRFTDLVQRIGLGTTEHPTAKELPDGPTSASISLEQEIRFCTTADGVRIAYATVGEGPPLVKAANWLNHLEFDWKSPIWRHLFEEFARDRLLVRYDERGNGLSDWNVEDLSLEALVQDLASVVDAVGLDRFPILGISQGGPVAIAYAVRHPEKVSHLILYGSYARGWARRGAPPEELERRQAYLTLTKLGWGQDNPAFRQLWTSLFIPDGTREQWHWFNDLQRITTSPENAFRLLTEFGKLDVVDLLPQVKVPTLVLHCRNEAVAPFEEGRLIAGMIPGARFVPLEGRNHLLLESEPAWPKFVTEVRRFLGTPST